MSRVSERRESRSSQRRNRGICHWVSSPSRPGVSTVSVLSTPSMRDRFLMRRVTSSSPNWQAATVITHRLLEGRDLIALDRSATVRLEAKRERLTALFLEARSMLASLGGLEQILRTIIEGDGNGVVYPVERLRLVATPAWLAQARCSPDRSTLHACIGLQSIDRRGRQFAASHSCLHQGAGDQSASLGATSTVGSGSDCRGDRSRDRRSRPDRPLYDVVFRDLTPYA